MTTSNNLSCPLATTEKRLSDCMNLWLETKDNYFEPEHFRLSLNNCIQTMRNVTFVLQKTKSEFSNFDSWYVGWQEKLRKDTIMRWLISARNHVVKEGDLSTSSKLRISVVETWFAPPHVEIDAPPFIETEDFTRVLAQSMPKSKELKVGLLRAERRWVDEQLNECELLEALAYVYLMLYELLLDAHESLGYRYDLLECPWYVSSDPSRDQHPEWMKGQEWYRTIWLDLNTGEILHPACFPVEVLDDEEVRRHYADTQQRNGKREKPKSLKEEADMLFEGAKNILVIDGHHIPIAFLGYPNGHRDIVGLEMLNRTEKHFAIRSLAADIERNGANSVVFISEVWVSGTENYRLTPVGVESPDLGEALQLIAANTEGEAYIKQILFTRDKRGKINMGEELTSSENVYNMLAPIKEVWSKRREAK